MSRRGYNLKNKKTEATFPCANNFLPNQTTIMCPVEGKLAFSKPKKIVSSMRTPALTLSNHYYPRKGRFTSCFCAWAPLIPKKMPPLSPSGFRNTYFLRIRFKKKETSRQSEHGFSFQSSVHCWTLLASHESQPTLSSKGIAGKRLPNGRLGQK